MLDAVRRMLRTTLESVSEDEATVRDDVELATAALLVEMARADFAEDPDEFALIEKLLDERFALTAEQRAALVGRATGRADRAVSLHEFTRLLHEELTAEEKIGLVEMLWRLSLADGRIDKHEEHLVRKVAGLLYVSDRDLIGAKLRISEEAARQRSRGG